MGIGDAVDVQKSRSDQCARAGAGGWRAFPEQFDVEAAFLLGFTQGGLFRIFIQLDVAAEREPGVQFAMMDQQDFSAMNDEDGDGEIDFFVDVSHDKTSEFQVSSASSKAPRTERPSSRETSSTKPDPAHANDFLEFGAPLELGRLELNSRTNRNPWCSHRFHQRLLRGP